MPDDANEVSSLPVTINCVIIPIADATGEGGRTVIAVFVVTNVVENERAAATDYWATLGSIANSSVSGTLYEVGYGNTTSTQKSTIKKKADAALIKGSLKMVRCVPLLLKVNAARPKRLRNGDLVRYIAYLLRNNK